MMPRSDVAEVRGATIRAGDIRLLSKEELRIRVRELLTAEDQYVARVNELLDTNRILNRRATGMDSHWQSRAMKAEAECELWRKAWKQEFDRLGAAFDELKEVYCLVYAARGGAAKLAFHSVNDMRFPKPAHGVRHVWANVYPNYPDGGVVSERVADAVRDVLLVKRQVDA